METKKIKKEAVSVKKELVGKAGEVLANKAGDLLGNIGHPKKGKKMLKVLLAGVAIGTTLGVMVAPDKGSKTRKKVKNKAKEMKGKAQDLAGDIQKVINSQVS